TNDLTDEGLQAAEKGFKRIMEAFKSVHSLNSDIENNAPLDQKIDEIIQGAFDDMNDDFNTPRVLARLFELVTIVNSLKEGQIKMSEVSNDALEKIKSTLYTILFEIFGLKDESETNAGPVDGLMQLVIELRQLARTNKDWPTSDKIRDSLSDLNIQIKDGKEGSSWSYK
ncbi:MAG: DALR domain-containing protein, partial [Saprospiraceae bacterium]